MNPFSFTEKFVVKVNAISILLSHVDSSRYCRPDFIIIWSCCLLLFFYVRILRRVNAFMFYMISFLGLLLHMKTMCNIRMNRKIKFRTDTFDFEDIVDSRWCMMTSLIRHMPLQRLGSEGIFFRNENPNSGGMKNMFQFLTLITSLIFVYFGIMINRFSWSVILQFFLYHWLLYCENLSTAVLVPEFIEFSRCHWAEYRAARA